MRYIIREKLFHLANNSTITNEAGEPILHVDGKILSLHHRMVMRDRYNNEVASIHQRLIALRPTYEITRGGQELAKVHKKLISPLVDRFVVDIPGQENLHITGSIFEHEFTIKRGHWEIATASKRWFALRETYGVDIAPNQDDVLILACVLALELAEDEERRKKD